MHPSLPSSLLLARSHLLGRREGGHWEGRLSSSALSTATAVVAIALFERGGEKSSRNGALVERGLAWLIEHQNADGGWGDTVDSPSNLSTTVLGWSACGIAGGGGAPTPAIERAARWIERAVGSLEPEALAAAVRARYGKDRTFSAPILLVGALAGRLGPDGWRLVPQLPFELAAFPREWFATLRLPVVSYALPALIAIGEVRHVHAPSRNPLTSAARGLARNRTVEVLRQIQPSSGGFLEAVPLTAFVVMSLVAAGRRDHSVATRGLGFLAQAIRPDGSWPIDSNLATWATTLAVNGLGDTLASTLPGDERQAVCRWLLDQQHRAVHPYTGAAPGGWAWTDLPGGVPDADDTAGALIALRHLAGDDDEAVAAARAGIGWLMGLQNADGGIPTFCRGWTKLPFDRSGSDLTAHALRAWTAWLPACPDLRPSIVSAAAKAMRYLARTQRRDGAWTPLWFGNQQAPLEENPTYGTSRVLLSLPAAEAVSNAVLARRLADAARRWLLNAQDASGGWGGDRAVPPTIEETALAVSALASGPLTEEGERALEHGVAWLIEATEGGRTFPASPIGLYFAKLWYSEEMYPLLFTVEAFGAAEKVRRKKEEGRSGA